MTVKTHVGFAGEKSWTFRTFIGQMLDKDKVRGQMEDNSLTVKTHVGFAGDKSWTFRTFIGQMLDKDKVRTYARRMLDKC